MREQRISPKPTLDNLYIKSILHSLKTAVATSANFKLGFWLPLLGFRLELASQDRKQMIMPIARPVVLILDFLRGTYEKCGVFAIRWHKTRHAMHVQFIIIKHKIFPKKM